MIEQSPILITGCPRSGTSIIASIINLCGAFGGEMSKRGMYSNDIIHEKIVKPFISKLSIDPKGQYPLSYNESLQIPVNWKNSIEKAIIDQKYKYGQWMYKDALSSIIWPVWNYAFPNAKWIIVRRRTGDIIQSCLKTNYMCAFDNKENQKAIGVYTEKDGWLWWVHEYEKRFVEMIESGVNCKQIWPERMATGDYSQIYEMLDWLGLKWDKHIPEITTPLFDHSLQRYRREPNNKGTFTL
jgi:hypothetical protein